MRVTKLPNGAVIRTFKTPPTGFNPLEATQRQLQVLGFPRRPLENPKLLKRWEKIFSRPIRFIEPKFRSMPYKRHHLSKSKSRNEVYNNWSGVVLYSQPKTTVKWIEGTWTVPNVFPPITAKEGVWYSASTWIGIDGDGGSADILQAGCDSDVTISGGLLSRQVNPWWEWYPGGSFWITNFLVAQGDTINCLICVDDNSATNATVYFYNVTGGFAASFAASAPPGISLVGNCAEWVIEALEIDTNTPELASYGTVFFDDCNFGINRTNVQCLTGGETIDMNDPSGNIISSGSIVSPNLARVSYLRPPHQSERRS